MNEGFGGVWDCRWEDERRLSPLRRVRRHARWRQAISASLLGLLGMHGPRAFVLGARELALLHAASLSLRATLVATTSLPSPVPLCRSAAALAAGTAKAGAAPEAGGGGGGSAAGQVLAGQDSSAAAEGWWGRGAGLLQHLRARVLREAREQPPACACAVFFCNDLVRTRDAPTPNSTPRPSAPQLGVTHTP